MDFDDIVKIVDQVKVLEARLAAVEAAWYAARAGEARAVAALKRIADICRPETQGNTSEGLLAHACIMSLETAECALSEQPALDWLAQQRREAAAEENERWANEWWELARPSSLTASDFIARAAALRAGEVGDE